MAHQQQKDFCLYIKNRFPELFKNKWVLDIGSLDINGNNQYLFEDSGYIGIDLLPGRNVDFTSKGHELQFPDESFDVIISTECFEHDPFYESTIKNIVRMLKPGGLFLFSCATTGRPEHGTRRTTPHDAPFTHEFGEWGDYYKNLEADDISKIINLQEYFSEFEFSSQHITHDLYFWGIKQGTSKARTDYSFCMPDSGVNVLKTKFSNKKAQLNGEIKILTEEHALTQSKLASAEDRIKTLTQEHALSQSNLLSAEGRIKTLESDLLEIKNLLDEILNSDSWKITKPLRTLGNIVRENSLKNINAKNHHNKSSTFFQKTKKATGYLARGEFKALRDRIEFHRRESALMTATEKINSDKSKTWGIMTPGHTLFIAHLISERLHEHGWNTEILTEPPAEFDLALYIVICPQIFEKLPPGEKRISFQMEQSVSSRWFTEKYCKDLENSLAVLEYSLTNIEFLATKKIVYPHVYYLPIGASDTYGKNIEAGEKQFDIIFYGDSLSSPRRRRMLDEAKKHFKVKIVNDLFGDAMVHELKSARVVLNIHYYENALLEMPRIQECLSLGLAVVSEYSKDLADYPELKNAVTFFDEGNIDGMIAALKQALNSKNKDIESSVNASKKRFNFMFDRFLTGMNFIPSSYIKNTTIPVSSEFNTFALSLPETISRRRIFEKSKPKDCVIYDGIRLNPGWIGCGMSYSTLARHAIDNNLYNITIMEDDVILPSDYDEALSTIKRYLKENDGKWDVFLGVIALLHPDTEVLSVEVFEGRTFVTINKMMSMVHNIYAKSALNILSNWDSENINSQTNTIDRYMESSKDIRAVVTLPFLVSHHEDMYSTLWGFKNTQYKQMIEESERELTRKANNFKGTY